jgi:hypothetical protein
VNFLNEKDLRPSTPWRLSSHSSCPSNTSKLWTKT